MNDDDFPVQSVGAVVMSRQHSVICTAPNADMAEDIARRLNFSDIAGYANERAG